MAGEPLSPLVEALEKKAETFEVAAKDAAEDGRAFDEDRFLGASQAYRDAARTVRLFREEREQGQQGAPAPNGADRAGHEQSPSVSAPVGAAITSREAVWRPIDADAKDGEPLDFCNHHGNRFVNYRWDTEGRGGCWSNARHTHRHWRDRESVPADQAAYYMRVPAPPLASLPASEQEAGRSAPDPCGGCGETNSSKRCIGCMHDFGDAASAWVRAR